MRVFKLCCCKKKTELGSIGLVIKTGFVHHLSVQIEIFRTYAPTCTDSLLHRTYLLYARYSSPIISVVEWPLSIFFWLIFASINDVGRSSSCSLHSQICRILLIINFWPRKAEFAIVWPLFHSRWQRRPTQLALKLRKSRESLQMKTSNKQRAIENFREN